MEINIILDNDKVWLLNTVRRLIVKLKKNNIKINCIWVLPEKLSNLKGYKITLWYFKIFGIVVFLKLVLFHLVVLIINFLKGNNSHKKLAESYDIKFEYIKSLKDKKLITKLNNKRKNYNLIFTNHIINKRLLKLKNNYFINKHSSLLPAFGGLLPFIWTKIYNFPNGVTFHLVDKNIDSGKIIFQKKIHKRFVSMIEFYLYIYEKTPEYMIKSILNLKNQKFIKSKYKKSIFSLPEKTEYKRFLDCGGKIININDLLSINKIIKK